MVTTAERLSRRGKGKKVEVNSIVFRAGNEAIRAVRIYFAGIASLTFVHGAEIRAFSPSRPVQFRPSARADPPLNFISLNGGRYFLNRFQTP